MADSPISSLPAVENLSNGQPNIETDDLFVLEHINDGQKKACKVSGEQVTKFISRNVVAYDGSIVASNAAGGANYDPNTEKLTLILPHGPGFSTVIPGDTRAATPEEVAQLDGIVTTYDLMSEEVRLTNPDETIPSQKVGEITVYNGRNGTGLINSVANVGPSAGTTNVPKDGLIAALADDLFDMFWPVGSIYTSKTASVNPGDTTDGIFKRGTWVQITDRFILAAGTRAAGEQDGHETHQLTRAELPNVNIPIGDVARNYSGGTALNYSFAMFRTNAAGGQSWYFPARDDGTGGERVVTEPLGSGDAIDIMPPYEVAYIWERTA